MKSLYGLVGASGFGSEVMPLLKQNLNHLNDTEIEIVFVDSDRSKKYIDGIIVLSEEEFIDKEAEKKFYNVSISKPEIRFEVVSRLAEENLETISIFSGDTDKVFNVEFGRGSIVLPHVLFTSNISVGDFFHCNPKCTIAHDVKIGNFVTLAPGSIINGNVLIEDYAYIGAGSVIKQGLTIGQGSTVGMGSVVIRDVGPGETVVGNPARRI